MAENWNKRAQEHHSTSNADQSWFYQLQRESWYLEMLTSAFVIFLLFKVPGLLDDARQFLNFHYYNPFGGNFNPFFVFPLLLVAILKIPTYLILINLILHLGLRGFWIGVIGLTSVFTNDVQVGKLRYSSYFTQKLSDQLPTGTKLIRHLDNISSSIYGLSFYVLFLFISVTVWLFYFFILAFLFSLSKGLLWLIIIIFLLIFLFLSLLYFLDFLTLGVFRKSKWFSRVYYFIYRFFSTITLSFLSRWIYYTFLSNIKKWKVFSFLGIYLSIVYVLVGAELKPYQFYPVSKADVAETGGMIQRSFYDNLRDEDQRIHQCAIQSDIIQEDFLRLFIRYDPYMTEDIRNRFPQMPLPNDKTHRMYVDLSDTSRQSYSDFRINPPFQIAKDRAGIRGLNLPILGVSHYLTYPEAKTYTTILDSLNSYFHIYIDDSLYNDIKLHYTSHPNKGEKGFQAYVPAYQLSPGRHELKVTTLEVDQSTSNTDSVEIDENTHAVIPFWKTKSGNTNTKSVKKNSHVQP